MKHDDVKDLSMTRRTLCGAIAGMPLASWLAALPATAAESNYPNRPVRIVVPFAPGGPVDYVARLLGNEMAKSTGATFIVENRPGASGIIAAENIKRSAPDGYSVLITNTDSHVNNVGMFKKLPYDPIKDFVPAGIIAAIAAVLVSNSSIPARTLKEFIVYARQQPGGISMGTWGPGTYSHLAEASLARNVGLSVNFVPYKGELPLLQDVLANNLPAGMASLLSAKAHAEKGGLRIYAVNGLQRLPLLPDVPTFAEQGINEPLLKMRPPFVAFMPQGTPPAIVNGFNQRMKSALASASVVKDLADRGLEALGSTPDEHREELRHQLDVTLKLMRDIGIEPQS